MVHIVPAWFLGLVVVFFAGTGVTLAILSLIARAGKSKPAFYRDARNRVEPRFLTERRIEQMSLVGGGIAVVVVFVLLIKLPRERTILIWCGLIALGILVSLSSIVLFVAQWIAYPPTRNRPTGTHKKQQSKRRRTKYQAEHQATANEYERKQQESEKGRQKHQAEYQAKMHEVQRKQTEIEAIKDDLYPLFAILDDQSQKRGRLLAKVLNRFFKANDIPVKEAFDLVGQKGEGIADHIDGVVELDAHSYLVEIKWCKEPLGTQEVWPHLVRIFSSGYPGGVLMSYSGFTQSAIIACQEALSQKTVVLCELQEIVTLLEQNGSLKDFLEAKMTAAAVDKVPLFKPQSWPYGSSEQ
jgi:hypothetical protein